MCVCAWEKERESACAWERKRERFWASRGPSLRVIAAAIHAIYGYFINNKSVMFSLSDHVAIRLEDPPGVYLLLRFLAKLAHSSIVSISSLSQSAWTKPNRKDNFSSQKHSTLRPLRVEEYVWSSLWWVMNLTQNWEVRGLVPAAASYLTYTKLSLYRSQMSRCNNVSKALDFAFL